MHWAQVLRAAKTAYKDVEVEMRWRWRWSRSCRWRMWMRTRPPKRHLPTLWPTKTLTDERALCILRFWFWAWVFAVSLLKFFHFLFVISTDARINFALSGPLARLSSYVKKLNKNSNMARCAGTSSCQLRIMFRYRSGKRPRWPWAKALIEPALW